VSEQGRGGGYNVGTVLGTVNLNVAGAIKSANQFTKTVNEIPASTKQAGASVGSLTQTIGTLATKAGLVVGSILAIGYAAKRALDPLINFAQRGVREIDKLKLTSAGMAASIQMMYPAAPFEKAMGAAEKLIPLVEKMDATFSGGGDELVQMAEAMLRYGAAGDVMKLITDETGKQQKAFIGLAEAIKSQTKGQSFSLQVNQEIRALMSGQNVQGAALLRMLKSQNSELAKLIPQWSAQGTLLENLLPYLAGYVKASATVAGSLSAIKSTWETILNRILRAGFLPTYQSMVDLQKYMNRLFVDQKGELTNISKIIIVTIRGGWEVIKASLTLALELLRMFWVPLKGIYDEVGDTNKALVETVKLALRLLAGFTEIARMVTRAGVAIQGISKMLGVLGQSVKDVVSFPTSLAAWTKLSTIAKATGAVLKGSMTGVIGPSQEYLKTLKEIGAMKLLPEGAAGKFLWPYETRPATDTDKGKAAAAAAKKALQEETDLYEKLTAAIEETATQRALTIAIAGKEPEPQKKLLSTEIAALLVLRETIAAKDAQHRGEKAYVDYHRATQKQLAEIDKKILDDRLAYVEIERKKREEDLKQYLAAREAQVDAEGEFSAAEIQAAQRVRDLKIAYGVEAGTITRQQQVESVNQEIALNGEALRRFIGNEQEREALEQKRLDLLGRQHALQQALEKDDLAAIDLRLSREEYGSLAAIGYLKQKYDQLQTVRVEEGDITGELAKQNELRSLGSQWVDQVLSQYREESLTLEEQRSRLATLYQQWVEMGGIALPEVQRRLDEMSKSIEGMAFSVRNILMPALQQFQSDLSQWLIDLVDQWHGVTDAVGNFFDALWDQIVRQFMDVVAAKIVAWIVNVLWPSMEGSGGGGSKDKSNKGGASGGLVAAGIAAGNPWIVGAGIVAGIFGFAKGGIVTRPTFAHLAERGPEAVIPLEKMGQFGGGQINYTFAPQLSVASVTEQDLMRLQRRGLRSLNHELWRSGLRATAGSY